MQVIVPLQPGCHYHLYNRGNNREDLFREERNYAYFLELYGKYILPVADTYAYCLMKNHFHLLARIKTEEERLAETSQVSETCEVLPSPSRAFSNLFNAYTKAINKAYQRSSSLFEERFKRIRVDSDDYFTNLIFYIHFNPQKHGFVDDFRDWKWSSYGAMLSRGPTKMQRDAVLDWFDGRDRFEASHRGAVDERRIAPLIADDLI